MEPDRAAILFSLPTVPRQVILLDGRSGAGKTELAAWLAPAIGAQLVHLEDMYPGWDGLEAASRMVHDDILLRSRWRRWNWSENRTAEWHELDHRSPLVIEGCGALSSRNRSASTFALWLDLDAVTRKARALARDGETYRPHWDHWAAQEERFIARERPRSLADLVISA